MENKNHEAFLNKMKHLHGEVGIKWIEALPMTLEELSHKWGLVNLKPVENLSFNYVLEATRIQDQQLVILKLGVEKEDLEKECAALRTYKEGSLKVLEQDFSHKALLLEKVTPGFTLKEFFPEKDKEAVYQTSQLIKKLHSEQNPYPSNFKTMEEWLDSLFKINPILFPSPHLQKAAELAIELLETMSSKILLHGDLHHENILFSEQKGWVAIDPKGVVGEREYEVASFIKNPLCTILKVGSLLPSLLQERISQFSEHLNLDPERVKKWCYVDVVLTACWAVEDKLEHRPFLQIAESLRNIL